MTTSHSNIFATFETGFKDDRDEPSLDLETIRRCSLIITANSAGISEISKPLSDRGAQIRWFSATQAIAVFPSPMAASNAAKQKTTIIRLLLLSEIAADISAECNRYFKMDSWLIEKTKKNNFSAATAMYASIKPERDAQVATRLIGAHLGVRVPKKVTAESVKAPHIAPLVDAWDD